MKTTAQQNPPRSPFRKGGRYVFACEISRLKPPFCKGGLGGFHLRAWLSSQHRHCYLNSPLLESPSCLAEVFDVGGSQAVAWRRRLRAPPFRVGSWTKALPASGGMLYLTALPNSMLMKALLYEVRTLSLLMTTAIKSGLSNVFIGMKARFLFSSAGRSLTTVAKEMPSPIST